MIIALAVGDGDGLGVFVGLVSKSIGFQLVNNPKYMVTCKHDKVVIVKIMRFNMMRSLLQCCQINSIGCGTMAISARSMQGGGRMLDFPQPQR